jgi:hypothetical protein
MAVSATEKIIWRHEQRLEEALAIVLLYIKDVLNYKHTGNDAFVMNADRMEEIRKHARESDQKLVNIADGMENFTVQCAQCPGLNKKLALTGVLFDLLEGII